MLCLSVKANHQLRKAIMITPTDRKTKRIDLYVDESGQDTKGKLFVVVAVENSDELRWCCESFEKSSGKGKVKWRSAYRERRLTYLRSIMSEGSSLGATLFYSVFRRTTDYDLATIEGLRNLFADCVFLVLVFMSTLTVFPKLNVILTILACDNSVAL